ncbi:hypothetical protein MRX96_000188 [Rhipicephalus microplus]
MSVLRGEATYAMETWSGHRSTAGAMFLRLLFVAQIVTVCPWLSAVPVTQSCTAASSSNPVMADLFRCPTGISSLLSSRNATSSATTKLSQDTLGLSLPASTSSLHPPVKPYKRASHGPLCQWAWKHGRSDVLTPLVCCADRHGLPLAEHRPRDAVLYCCLE